MSRPIVPKICPGSCTSPGSCTRSGTEGATLGCLEPVCRDAFPSELGEPSSVTSSPAEVRSPKVLQTPSVPWGEDEDEQDDNARGLLVEPNGAASEAAASDDGGAGAEASGIRVRPADLGADHAHVYAMMRASVSKGGAVGPPKLASPRNQRFSVSYLPTPPISPHVAADAKKAAVRHALSALDQEAYKLRCSGELGPALLLSSEALEARRELRAIIDDSENNGSLWTWFVSKDQKHTLDEEPDVL